MDNQNIAIIGLNNAGTEFFKAMVELKEKGVNILGVSESAFTEGSQMAQQLGINNVSIDEIVNMGSDVDVIFDLTGSREVRKELRTTLFSSKNLHTVIAPECVARLMYTLIGDTALPESSAESIGY